jgi:NAD-dependent DNA ligase
VNRHPLELAVLAHRYRYYVLCNPVIDDYDYDQLERKAKQALPPDSPVHGVGSDRASDYPPDVVEAALR